MEPLTPPDCDLRGLPFMPLDVVRLTDSDLFALSTGDEFKAAVTLWCKAWLQIPAASLPNDDRILAHLSGTGTRWKRLRDMALRGFVIASDGRLYHPVIAEKAAEAWRHRQKQREKANKRWGNASDRGAGTAAAHATAYAPAMQGTGTGTGTGIYSVDKSTGDEPPPDPVKVMFDAGLGYLAECGIASAKARPLLGKWKKDQGVARVIEALGAAQRQGVIDPVSWIEARWKAANDQGGRRYAEAPC